MLRSRDGQIEPGLFMKFVADAQQMAISRPDGWTLLLAVSANRSVFQNPRARRPDFSVVSISSTATVTRTSFWLHLDEACKEENNRVGTLPESGGKSRDR